MSKNVKRESEDELNDSDEDMEEQNWDDFVADDDEEEFDSDIFCLFCVSTFKSSDEVFEHCKLSHKFDFRSLKSVFGLDFYGCFKLINFVRSQVAKNCCWACGCSFESKEDLHGHSHDIVNFEERILPWDDDKYLNSFLPEDPLLHNFFEDDECEEDYNVIADDDELVRIWNTEKLKIDDESDLKTVAPACNTSLKDGSKQSVCASATHSTLEVPSEKVPVSSCNSSNGRLSFGNPNNKPLRISPAKISENEIFNVNRSYFGSYSSFGIHREMISDKVRTDAYHRALTGNPSLLRGAVVMDVGCGTGILSLFAAKAGAAGVIAVEASDKMAEVASQIAKENGLLWCGSKKESSNDCTGVIKVVHGMIEDVSSEEVKPQSVDVLVSEWMGYCLLYESMLSSVLTARDKWLKPGGAILPDMATMFAAGFSKGATSIPFWEDVYGFSMSCIGKELVEDASKHPIVDVVDSQDIVTSAAVLQTFDLVTMRSEEMNFTETVELEPKFDISKSIPDSEYRTVWCYGVVLWFENGFTGRFCHENPVILSTSPFTPSTHWSQTIFTFKEPIALSSGKPKANISAAAVGTEASPAMKLSLRISIARAQEHRSIDIAIETTAIGFEGRKHSLPVQIFNLC
ncbi:hypothetical protein AgCh_000282 [Apium graveolens]